MKKVIVLLIILLFSVTMLTSCQPTPDEQVVVQKDLEQMIEKSQEGNESSEKLTIFETPERFVVSLINAKENVIVTADAEIIIPNTDKIPIALVNKQMFSQETADKLMELLLQGQMLYDIEGYSQITKAEIQEKLVELYAMRAGSMPVNVDGEDSDSVEVLNQTIEIWENELKDAPEETKRIPAKTTFQKRELPGTESIEPYDYIEGIAEIDGESAYFLVQNWTEENRINIEFYRSMNVRYHYDSIDKFIGKLEIDVSKLILDISAEEAQAQADALIEGLGQSTDMVCACVEPGISLEGSEGWEEGQEPDYSNIPTAYIVRYVRAVNKVPITYTDDTGTRIEDEEIYAKPWPYETISIIIDEKGIVEFNWTSPYTTPEIITEDVNLLPFSDIQNTFEKMIMVKYSYEEEGALQLDIKSVHLGLMRVTNPEQRDSGLLIPVWDFFGTITMMPENGEPYLFSSTGSVLTLNAVDGAIIDRGFGY